MEDDPLAPAFDELCDATGNPDFRGVTGFTFGGGGGGGFGPGAWGEACPPPTGRGVLPPRTPGWSVGPARLGVR